MWYLVRRHLDFTIDQWEELPWWHQLVYLEGIEWEFYDPDGDDGEENDDTEGLAGVEAMGMNVQRVEAPVQ